jgi:hypothetical protein
MTLFFLGTTLNKNQFKKITGHVVNQYIKERSEIIKEILIRREVIPVTLIRKLKFYALPIQDFEKYTNKYSQVIIKLKDGLNIESYVAFTGEDQNIVFEKVNAQYSYGNMDKETKANYVADLDGEFGDKIILLYKKDYVQPPC